MNSSRSTRSRNSILPCIEGLENRRLLSASMPLPQMEPISTAPVPPPVAAALNLIHAEKGEAFTAVLGTVPTAFSTGWKVTGTINWGDGSATSPATFVRLANGALGIEGSHTYDLDGLDLITITLDATPIPVGGISNPIIAQTKVYADAQVISSQGGVTVEENAATPFTANVGSFTTKFSLTSLTAEISWGDGTTSMGKILATPAAGAGSSTSPVAGGFVVQGTHTYAKSGSYLVSVIVLATVPPPTATSGVISPPIIAVVADIESVIDVLPGPVSTLA